MPDDFDYCETLVREGDKDRFVAALFAPRQHRRSLYALYAFNIELARVRELAREPMPGEIRLQWWRDVLGGLRTGEAGPVASALITTVARYRLPVDVLLEMIEARSFDLYDDPMGSLSELEAYADKTSSALMTLAAQIINDGQETGVAEPARHAGIAYAIAGLLTALPLHAASRQLYIPLDLIERHGARPDNVFARNGTPGLKVALAELRDVARRHLSQLTIADIPQVLVPAFLPAALAAPMLKRQERDVDPFSPSPLPLWRRQWLLWRAARHPRRIVDR
ncbi:MAG: phytoene/squalene synthase family protein [Rhizobiales bacterium]|nr:phytoene/squalene synthase family protein [Hyphomicrobiales bacterium]